MPKKPVLREAFENETVHLDATTFVECVFRNCQLVYSGGPRPDIVDCDFDRLDVRFEGAAGETLLLLRDFYNGFGEGGRRITEAFFGTIRQPPGEG